MTTILPPQELILYRGLAKTAAVLLICLRIDALYPGRAIADFEIADILEQDRRTILRHLRSLSASGLMLEQRENRYVLTPLGRNTLFADRQTTYLSIEETKKTSDESFPRAQNVPHDLIDDDSISNNDSDSSSSISEHAKCALYLQHTDLLFGSPVSGKGIEDRDPIHVLAWVAKAYNDRRQLNNPQGLVFRRLQANECPPVWLLKDPAQGLPREYLLAIGWLVEQEETEPLEVGEVEEQADPIPDDIRTAWKTIRHLVELRYEKGNFRACVTSLFRPLSFADGILRVDVLLERHLNNENFKTELEKLLREQGQDIRVQFCIRGAA